MSAGNEFAEISVLIPGYSVEDLPTDLAEAEAASLWNAVSCAWHPRLLVQSGTLPIFRQAESQYGYPGRRLVLVPTPAESWMPHEWRSVLRDQDHIILDGCTSRAEWLQRIESEVSWLPSPSAENGACGTAGFVLVEDFLALGTVQLQLQLLSRRRHHFVDPDLILMYREVRAAAEASSRGDEAEVRVHLAVCFEHLRDIREKVYPQNCYLLDVCLPGEGDSAEVILGAIESSAPLNLLISGRELLSLGEGNPAALDVVRAAVDAERLCLLTGHDVETRTGLGSMASVLNDLRRAAEAVETVTGRLPRHWGRRRFGLVASLPMILSLRGFESALHVALDDGLYPDRERSQFEWQSPDGTTIAASSRIPLAIDSAAGFQRLADRYNESMQEDPVAALFLARLPEMRGPWLDDLRRTAAYAPVLGEFVTMESLCHAAEGSRMAEANQHSDYVSPALIQSMVLRTEFPVSGPATLRRWQQQLEAMRLLAAMVWMIRGDMVGLRVNERLREVEVQLADLEFLQTDVSSTLPEKAPQIASCGETIAQELQFLARDLAEVIQGRIPSKDSAGKRGILLLNPLPFGRVHGLTWPAGWGHPCADAAIEAAERAVAAERLLVRLPPGGFVWIREAGDGDPVQSATQAARREPPLAEPLLLRNRHFEVELSERTGGISGVRFHGQRGNRLSQQAGFRFEREIVLPADEAGEIRRESYAQPRLVSHRVLESGSVFAAVETVVELQSPLDRSCVGTVRQTTRVDRLRSRIELQLVVENGTDSLKGNPWLSGWCCRFAWDNESAAITRGVLGQAAGFRLERIESPDYVEVADGDRRFVVCADGRPWHRRSGNRMLDSLLMVEGEEETTFRFWIDFDQPFPLRTTDQMLTPVIEHRTTGKSPSGLTSSWILGLSAANVELVQAVYTVRRPEASDELTLILCETEGSDVDCLVRTARRPTAAWLKGAGDGTRTTLEIADAGVVVTLRAWQLREMLMVF